MVPFLATLRTVFCWLLLAWVAQAQAPTLEQWVHERHYHAALRKIRQLEPKANSGERLRLLLLKADCLVQLEELEEAGRLLARYPVERANPRFHRVRGQWNKLRRDTKLARQDFEHVLTFPGALKEHFIACCEMAVLEAEANHPQQADRWWARAVDLADRTALDPHSWSRLYRSQWAVLQKTGRHEEALVACRLARQHMKALKHEVAVQGSWLHEAWILKDLGRFDEAERAWMRAVEHLQPGGSGMFLAWGYPMLYGREDRAAVRRWLALAERQKPEGWPEFERFHFRLLQGQMYLIGLNEPRAALRYFREAEKQAARKPRTAGERMAVNLNFHKFGPERPTEIHQVLWLELKALESAPPEERAAFMESKLDLLPRQEQGPWLYQLGQSYADAKRDDAFERALRVSSGLQRTRLLRAIADAYLDDGNLAKARPLVAELRSELERVPPDEAVDLADNLLLNEGRRRVRSVRGAGELELPLSPELLARVEKAEEKMLERQMLNADLGEVARYYLRLAERLLAQNRLTEALLAAQRAREWAEKGKFASRAADSDKLAAFLHYQLGEREAALQLIRRAREFYARERQSADEKASARLEAAICATTGTTLRPAGPEWLSKQDFLGKTGALTKEHPDLLTSIEMLPASFAQLPERLSPEQLVAQFYLGPRELVLMVASREGLGLRRMQIERQQVEEWVRNLPERAVDLHRALIQPLEPYLEKKSLMLLSHGPLLGLRWDLLRDPAGKPLDLQWSLWAGEATQRYLSGKPAVVAVGGVQGVDLPASLREVRSIPGEVHLLTGAEATRSRLRESLPHADVVHLATHSQSDRIYLSDGALTLEEVYRLPLKPGALVVLSSCNSADPQKQERAPVTLAAAFLAAGASQVVASLTRVSDEETQALFGEFYRELGKGAVPAEALRRAKAARRQAVGPADWASFVILTGM